MALITTIIIIISLALTLGVLGYMTYKSLHAIFDQACELQKIIMMETDRRFSLFIKIIDSLVNKADYEQTILKEIVHLRSQAQRYRMLNSHKEQFSAEEKISQLAVEIKLIFEQYPQLSSIADSENVQEEILFMENKLADLKSRYNNKVRDFHNKKHSFVGRFIMKLCKHSFTQTLEYWKIKS